MSVVMRPTGVTTVRLITTGRTGAPAGVLGTPYGMAYLLRRLSVLANFDSLALQAP